MELRQNVDWNDYVELLRQVYRTFPQYRDNNAQLIREIVGGTSLFSQNIAKSWAGVYDRGKLAAAAVLICSRKTPDYLSLAFFEALDSPAAINLLLEHAKRVASDWRVGKVVAGLNGHMNYGMGLLCDNFDQPASFWSSFNPPYYYEILKQTAEQEFALTSFVFDLNSLDFDKFKALFSRLDRRFCYRTANLKKLNQEMTVYTDLINGCFVDHPFYWQRTEAENLEMVDALLPFLRGENLIIAEENGHAVGYILWHPDFNQLLSPGQSLGFVALLKYRIGWPKIRRFKIAEIGVLPKYKGSGLIFGLLRECFRLARSRYQHCESGWIMEDNFLSKNLCSHFAGQEYKHYKVLEFHV